MNTLAQLDDDYRRELSQPSPAGNYVSRIPDGRYTAVIEQLELGETKSTGNPMLKWTLTITGPTHAGARIRKNRVITKNTLRYVRMDLDASGIRLAKLSDLPACLNQAVRQEVDVTKRTQNGSEEVWIEGRPHGHAAQAAGELDDDIPF